MPTGKNYRIDPYSRRLSVETLEDRRMLATFSVTNLLDGPVTAAGDLPGSLRQAIFDANNLAGPDDIDLTGVSGTLLMTDGEFEITDAVAINGPGQNSLTIDAGNGTDGVFATGDGHRIFNVDDVSSSSRIDVELRDITLTGGDPSLQGGAIVSLENLTIENSFITGNSAGIFFTSKGGGVSIIGATLVVRNSTINGNYAASSGGGIYARDSDLELTRTIISGNDSDSSGGGIANVDSNSLIQESQISGNSAFRHGGGVSNRGFGYSSIIANSTLSGNTSRFSGGALTEYSGTTTLISSTIEGNSSLTGRGSIAANWDNFVTTIVLRNSIVSNTTDASGLPSADLASGPPDITKFYVDYSLVEDSGAVTITGSDNVVSVDPLLGPLQDNGGPTFTHALLPGSPAIDMGDPVFSAPPDFDQRGDPFTRVHNGRIDIGAYEAQPLLADANGDHVVDGLDLLLIQIGGGDIARWDADYGASEPMELPSLVVTTDQDVVDAFDGLTSLREAIEYANGLAGADTISFDASLTGGTILLTEGELRITDSLTIDGLGQNSLTIDAGNGTDSVFATGDGHRIFTIDDGTAALINVSISGLTLTGGDAANAPEAPSGTDGENGEAGGAIFSLEHLTVANSTISGNATGQGGQSNYHPGSGGAGGGIYVQYGDLTLTNSTVSANQTGMGGYGIGFTFPEADGGHGGGIFSGSGNATITGSSIVDNRTGDGPLTNTPSTGTAGDGGSGGGIYNAGGVLNIAGSSISGNFTGDGGHQSGYGGTAGSGGGIAHFGTLLSIADSSIENNIVGRTLKLDGQFGNPGGSGGGIYAVDSEVMITASTISGNRGADAVIYRGYGGKGGGIYNKNGNMTITGSTISGNFTGRSGEEVFGGIQGGSGGGIYQSGGSLTIRSTTISGNVTAEGGSSFYGGSNGGHGGGIAHLGTNLTIEDSTISDNRTGRGGDGGSSSSGSGTGGAGGGVFAVSTSVSIEGSTISGNRTGDGGDATNGGNGGSGGGLSISADQLAISHCTIVSNRTGDPTEPSSNVRGGDGGGIRLVSVDSSTISGSIIADNHVGYFYTYSGPAELGLGPDIRGGSAGWTLTHSLIGDNTDTSLTEAQSPDINGNLIGSAAGAGVIDPLLGPLQDNGGPTFTHALLPGSPAIDMGDPVFSVPPDFDQRGDPFTRLHNGRIDIGAYESQPLLADANGDHVVDGLDLLLIQIGGGDIARWDAEYGVSEPSAPPLAATQSGVEPSVASFWLALPETVADNREEPLPEDAAFAFVEQATILADVSEADDIRDSQTIAAGATDSSDDLEDAELDEALVALFG